MKKVYMPTEKELYTMQEMGANMYKYLLVKAIESLIVDGVNYPNKGKLKTAYKYLRENPEIAHAICMMYPGEIKYSEIAQNDTELCLKLLDKEVNNPIYTLDNLAYFENGVGILNNSQVEEKTLSMLDEYLDTCPEYRFKYKNSSLLNRIFSRNFHGFSQIVALPAQSILFKIEPAYVLSNEVTGSVDKIDALKKGVNAYAERYGISKYTGMEYTDVDILTNPDTGVKRLIKCINQNKNNLY